MAVHEIIGFPRDPVIPQPLHKIEGRVHPQPLSSRSHCTKSKAGCIVQGISKHRRRAKATEGDLLHGCA